MLAALLVMPGGMALNFIFPSGPTACGLTASRRFTIRWGPLYSFLPTSRHDPARFGQGFLGFLTAGGFGFLTAGFRFFCLGFGPRLNRTPFVPTALLRVFAGMLVGFNLGVLFFFKAVQACLCGPRCPSRWLSGLSRTRCTRPSLVCTWNAAQQHTA